MALVILILVLLVAAVLRSVAELREIYEDNNEETGKPKPDLVKEDAPGRATEGTESAKIRTSGRSSEPPPTRQSA
jgi:hypothetical protein